MFFGLPRIGIPMLASGAGAAATSIQLVGTATYSGDVLTTQSLSLTSLTGGIGTAPAAGDVVVVVNGVAGVTNMTPAATGYTQIAQLYANGVDYDASLYVGLKVMGATPDTAATVTASTASTASGQVVRALVFRGVNGATPQDVAATTATGTGSDKPNPPSITPTTAGALLLGVGLGARSPDGNYTFTSSDFTSFFSLTDTGNVRTPILGMGFKAWASGAFDAAAFTGSPASTGDASWAAVSAALRPA